ncbi:3'(2'),5'-bisphosphate nucleotidase CysQ [Balneola sp. MJW-20]|uniref:3'(2'),5'-bisphosphate nucleotidase CysQ n=1 Tax=Gracilimonas aurantiaca TaxID=3234185 RepID=UPI0034673143
MLNKVIKLAEEAGEKIMAFYALDIKVDRKDDNSPLTKADLAAHHHIVDGLKEIDPDTPVISEESGVPEFSERKDWDRYWLVDPLDGTKEFIKKNGEFTVNIALMVNRKPVMGVVYAPAMNLMYYAEKSLGSFRRQKAEGRSEQTERIFSEPVDKSHPIKIVESRSHGSPELEAYLEKEGFNVEERVKSGSSLKICLVADGTADLYPRMGPTMEWDVAAGDAVYRYSAEDGIFESGIEYNKEDLLNPSFVIGLG